ncbi:MAG: 3-hydroxyacyl-ACP dehydratase FabZ [Candidatus Omnitrophica bacterium]|nr:3-hydroxyacyl-ACP dehydratase FabZ [Candidatus Omnitrophota bacterium]
MELGLNTIKKALHQRYPFLMVDRVIEFEKGKRAIGIKNVSVNEPFFQGHFPERKIMPGVLISEVMAQTGAMLFYDEDKKENPTYYLGSIKTRFLQPVVPGDTLRVEVTPVKITKDAGIINAIASVNGKTVAKGEFTFKAIQ